MNNKCFIWICVWDRPKPDFHRHLAMNLASRNLLVPTRALSDRCPMNRLLLLIYVITSLFAFVGCGTFRREWTQSISQTIPSEGITGPWEGYWHSEKANHKGKLRCLITPSSKISPSGAPLYNFHYWAQWMIFRGAYRTVFPVIETPSKEASFSGDFNLGWLAGVYSHDGTIAGNTFTAHFKSTRGDYGVLRLQRPSR